MAFLQMEELPGQNPGLVLPSSTGMPAALLRLWLCPGTNRGFLLAECVKDLLVEIL